MWASRKSEIHSFIQTKILIHKIKKSTLSNHCRIAKFGPGNLDGSKRVGFNKSLIESMRLFLSYMGVKVCTGLKQLTWCDGEENEGGKRA
jgi:hypothetical protein